MKTNRGRRLYGHPANSDARFHIVPGTKTTPVPVLDRGGAIKGHRLDVLMPPLTEPRTGAINWLTSKSTCRSISKPSRRTPVHLSPTDFNMQFVSSVWFRVIKELA